MLKNIQNLRMLAGQCNSNVLGLYCGGTGSNLCRDTGHPDCEIFCGFLSFSKLVTGYYLN